MACDLHRRLEILLCLLVLPHHVVYSAQVVQSGRVWRRPLGDLFEEHRGLGLPGLFAAKRCAILQPLDVPWQASFHAVRLGRGVQPICLVDGVVFEVRDGEVQSSLEDLRVSEAVRGRGDTQRELGLVALQQSEVLLRTGHVVLLGPDQTGSFQRGLWRRPPDPIGATVRWHHRAQHDRQRLELVGVALEHGFDERRRRRFNRLLVNVGASC
mmetsp:Transcript_76311/g.220473  ORF Transcript_76311/g.220473 Transcript_76311/m.220473 type:complete len:212 (-) Transcript_76311:314-949(-)